MPRVLERLPFVLVEYSGAWLLIPSLTPRSRQRPIPPPHRRNGFVNNVIIKYWVADAMKAWTEDDFAKVAVLAPLAVEHLGKAVLWKINPVLVVPLSQDSEQSLMGLATKPDLADPRLRTIGLSALLRRLDQVMGALPIDRKKCSRMVEVRNGAIHVGSPTYSRYVLLDSLALIKSLLEKLDEDPEAFFGDHHWSVIKLLEQQRTEVGHKVAAKLARARLHLTDLEERLGETAFREVTDLLEEQADLLDPEDFGTNLYAIERPCPVCGSRGRLFGRVDAEAEPNWDVEPWEASSIRCTPQDFNGELPFTRRSSPAMSAVSP